MHDLLIRGARVFDGSGAPARRCDVAVSGGRIAALGEGLGAARETVDAGGLALMPGVIDVHTHYDAQLTWDPFGDPSPALGVTTVVIGNCGFGIAPCKPGDRDLTLRNLTHVEGMSLSALRQGVDWRFESFGQYLDFLGRRGVGVNVASFIGHSAIRTFVLGEDAPRRAATPDEVAAMAALVRDGMRQGAIGFATSTSPAHNGEGGIPMPSRLAEDAELSDLVAAMGEGGRGTFMLTKGGQTKIPFLASLARRAKRPVVIAAILHSSVDPEGTFRDLAQIDAARGEGLGLYGQISCCPLSNEFTLRSPYPFEGLAAWKPAMTAKGDAVKRVYADPEFRAKVRAELALPPTFRLFNDEWHKVEVTEVKRAEHRALEGQTLDRIAARRGVSALDAMLDLALAEDLDTLFTAMLLNSDEAAVGRMIRNPDTVVALSDAGAHMTFFCDAGYALHLLGHWVRERGLLSWEEAIRRLTGQPAAIYGISDRGRIAPGLAADLMLFDPARIGRGPKRRVTDLPGGAPRLVTPGIGIEGVWVNGKRIVDRDAMVAAAPLAGQVLRSFAA
ncbi:MAG: amidohydrolase family protein [Alphaproteobacteria bacterium]|nr:amidohydrolase family protein [Alphaproteobacteria bacterium]